MAAATSISSLLLSENCIILFSIVCICQLIRFCLGFLGGFQKRENEDVVWFVFPMELGEVAYRTMQEMYHKNLSSMKLEELE